MITILGFKAIIEDVRSGDFDLFLTILYILILPIVIALDIIFAIPIIKIWKLFIGLFI